VLQLLFCDPKTGKISVICSCDTFGIIRSLLTFRLTGSSKGLLTLKDFIINRGKIETRVF